MKFKYIITYSLYFVIFCYTIAIILMPPTTAVDSESCLSNPQYLPINFFSFIDTEADPFHMIVIGDSIAWGAGLMNDKKYFYLTAEWLQDKLKRPVDITVYAHTGATIEPQLGTCRDADCGSAYPSLLEQADSINNDVDLILVSGGINDVGVETIINSDTPGEKIQQKTEHIEYSMKDLLKKILLKSPNAKIIVTGYYPIFSKDTDNLYYDKIYPIVHDNFLSDKPIDKDNYKAILIENSKKFHDISDASIKSAIFGSQIKDNLGVDRIVFSQVNFPSGNCFGTLKWWGDVSWLWSFDLNWLKDVNDKLKKNPTQSIDYTQAKTNDQRYQYRIEHCSNADPKDIKRIVWDKIAAIAHPNENGAKQYRDAIKNSIEEKGLTWLDPNYKSDWYSSLISNIINLALNGKIETSKQPLASSVSYGADNIPPLVQAFGVTPAILSPGELVTIDYTVSDSGGSGVRQIDLWLKDSQTDWRGIKSYSVPSRDDLISGSFTDSPREPGKYWYRIQVIDNSGNWNYEMNSNSINRPVSYAPVMVDVKESYLRTNEYLDSSDASCTPESVEARCYSPDACVGCNGECFVPGSYSISDENWICSQGKWKNAEPKDARVKNWNAKGIHFANDCLKGKEAIECFDEALKLDPNFFAAWHNKGNVLNKLNYTDEAKKCWDEASRLHPGFCTQHRGLYVSPVPGLGCTYSLPGFGVESDCDNN